MWVWFVFSVGSFALVYFVDGSGCLVLLVWSALAAAVHRLFGSAAARRLDEEALRHEAVASELDSSEDGVAISDAANLVDRVGELAMNNASSLEGFVLGGAARLVAHVAHETTGNAEARAHRATALGKRTEAENIRAATWLVFVGVLGTSSIAVGLGHWGVMPTPEARLRAAEVRAEESRAELSYQARVAAERARRSACVAFSDAARDFERVSPRATRDERRTNALRVVDAFRSWALSSQTSRPEWASSVEIVLGDVERSASLVDSAATSGRRRAESALDRSLRDLRTLLLERHRDIEPVALCGSPATE